MYQMSQSYARMPGSNLEYIAQSAVNYSARSFSSQPAYATISLPASPSFSYHIPPAGPTVSYPQSALGPYTIFHPQTEYHFMPEQFLKPGKEGIFVGEAAQLRPFVEETFQKLFQQPFPVDIKISICNQKQFRTLAPHPSTIGLSINRRQQGLLSEIFVLNDSLARVMLTVGHELGHVLTSTLEDKHDEEAKAYAFSLAWMKSIREHNIAGLGNSFITENPAENGLHNVAFRFVEKLLQQGRKAWEVYLELIGGRVSFVSSQTRWGANVSLTSGYE